MHTTDWSEIVNRTHTQHTRTHGGGGGGGVGPRVLLLVLALSPPIYVQYLSPGILYT